MHKFTLLSAMWLLFVLTACGGGSGEGAVANSVPDNAVEINIIYAPESDPYMQQIIPAFNDSYQQGINPITGERLAGGEQPVFITGESGSSGVVMQGIVNALTVPNSVNSAQPVIFQPSVSHWLALANFRTNREVFDLSETRGTALAPVVMAIWESRLQAIQNTVGYDEIGWEELLMVLDSENGWQDFGIPNGRRTVFYGHTDPFVSSTALSTLIAEFYASAQDNGFTGRRLTLDTVSDEVVQQGVRDIESLIRHYSRRTTEFKNYIAQGPDYLDFVALEENDLIAINRGQTDFQPPEQLVALYPKEGTFWHEHPMGIVNASWVSDEQQAAARVFVDYVLLPENQELIMSYGFRPANPDVALDFPFTPENGVTLEGPTTVLDVPDPEVISAIQNSWSFVKKQADILLLIDVSGSMAQQDKLEQAKTAALAFLDNTEVTNRVGLAVFSEDVRLVVPLDILENNIVTLQQAIETLVPEGGTALYDALSVQTKFMNNLDSEDRIRSIVLLSDGEDTTSEINDLSDVVDAIEASRDELNPVLVVPVGYGQLNDTLIRVLQRIADASNTTWVSGDPNNIGELLELISSFF